MAAGHQILKDVYFCRRNAPDQLTELGSEHYIVTILAPSIAVSSCRDEKSLAVIFDLKNLKSRHGKFMINKK